MALDAMIGILGILGILLLITKKPWLKGIGALLMTAVAILSIVKVTHWAEPVEAWLLRHF